MTIQQRLRSDKRGVTIAKISLNFKNLVAKRNVNGALKLLSDNMHSEILPLTLEILELLAQKHLEPKEPSREKLIQGPTRPTDLIAYDDTDESIIMTASKPEGLDAGSWRRILTCRAFGTAPVDLCKVFTQLIKTLRVEELESTSFLESFDKKWLKILG